MGLFLTTNKRVLLTGGRAPVALHLARMLNRDGFTVYIAESEPYHLTKKSNAIQQSFTIPKPNDQHEQFISTLLQCCVQHHIQLIIPTCEEIFHIAKAKMMFEQQGIAVFCEPIETLHLLHNKYTFNRFLQARGFVYPKTQQFTTIQELQCFLQSAPTEYVLKASYSRFASHVYFVRTVDQLPQIEISQDNPWILQRSIAGSQYCSYSVVRQGKLLAHTCYPTLYTAGIGANVFFKHIEMPQIEQFVRKFAKELNFTGQIAFDFIKGADGAFYPLECNPRATSGLHLFEEVADFTQLFVEDTQQVLYPTNATYKLGLPMLLSGGLFKKPRTFLRDFLAARDVIYARTDPIPYFYQAVYVVVLLTRKLKTGQSLTELMTTDIEWGGK